MTGGHVPFPHDLGLPPAGTPGRLDIATRWSGIARLLSLDVVAPYHEPMGLALGTPDALVSAARTAFFSVAEELRTDPEAAYAYTTRLPQAVRDELAEDDADRVLRWCKTTYLADAFADQPEWMTYLEALQNFPKDLPPTSRHLRLDWWREAMRAVSSVSDLSELENQFQWSYEQPLSDDDLRIFVESGFTKDDSGNHPFDQVYFIAELHRFQVLASQWASTLSSEQLDELRNDVVAARHAAARPVSEALPRLDALVGPAHGGTAA